MAKNLQKLLIFSVLISFNSLMVKSNEVSNNSFEICCWNLDSAHNIDSTFYIDSVEITIPLPANLKSVKQNHIRFFKLGELTDFEMAFQSEDKKEFFSMDRPFPIKEHLNDTTSLKKILQNHLEYISSQLIPGPDLILRDYNETFPCYLLVIFDHPEYKYKPKIIFEKFDLIYADFYYCMMRNGVLYCFRYGIETNLIDMRFEKIIKMLKNIKISENHKSN